MEITLRRLSCLSMLALLTLFSATAWSQETADTKERDTGPRNLVITYRSTPAKRVAFRQYMLRTGLGRFEKWKKDGMLQDYRILFNRYVDADTWDMMAILFFPDYAHVDRWRDVEVESPGGLTEEGLGLTTPVNTYSMDLIWHGDSSAKSIRGKTVFFVIPYDYYPHTIEEYVKYVNTYVIPQIDGWMRENIMATYRIFLNRYSTSRPWKSLFILEYRDAQSFGARERTMAKVRAALKDNPAWKSLSDTKQSMRVEKETVVADELLLP
jgi:hypothetical protein